MIHISEIEKKCKMAKMWFEIWLFCLNFTYFAAIAFPTNHSETQISCSWTEIGHKITLSQEAFESKCDLSKLPKDDSLRTLCFALREKLEEICQNGAKGESFPVKEVMK